MSNHCLNGYFFIVSGMVLSCASRQPAAPPDDYQNLTISISNRDMETPISLMSVAIDDEIVFRGVVLSAHNGQYTYVVTHLPSEQGVVLSVSSETERANLRMSKEIWIRKGVWVVVSRENSPSEEPRLDISVSYEATELIEPNPF